SGVEYGSPPKHRITYCILNTFVLSPGIFLSPGPNNGAVDITLVSYCSVINAEIKNYIKINKLIIKGNCTIALTTRMPAHG
ncbi:hypothetical protein JTM61_35770, partial [Pseudomonas aeruginosa]|nr:hypothetical protein [Pseudomonas aeruginosa]